MATDNYDALVRKVRLWANRDIDILTDALIQDFIRYAADKAYRHLRIPPMEKAFIYNSTNITTDMVNNNCLRVPEDLIEFIHIRSIDSFGNGNSIVYNNKADTRTFHDFISEKYDPRYTWTRQGADILFPNNPGISADCEYEIFYYGRFCAPGTEDADGNENPNWFVDQNERILLFGALGEAFTYLAEDDQAGKYLQLWQTEIDELNREETMRHASGGNVQVNFDGRGMI